MVINMKKDPIFYFLIDALIIATLLVTLYPMIYIISSSLSSTQAVLAGKVWLFPVDFSLSGYKAVFKSSLILTGYSNTLFYTLIGTFINVVMTIMVAYPLSRRKLIGRNLFVFLFVFTMLFNGGLIPNYLLISKLNLLDSRLAMILPNAISVWNVIITRVYFQKSIPGELREAATIDGCDDFKYIFLILLPLSTAIIAVISLFYAVGHWNAFFNAFLYLTSKSKFPLQIVLRDILIANQSLTDMIESGGSLSPKDVEARQGLVFLIRYAVIIVASLPIWMVYPFVQKHFVKGVMIGSLKG